MSPRAYSALAFCLLFTVLAFGCQVADSQVTTTVSLPGIAYDTLPTASQESFILRSDRYLSELTPEAMVNALCFGQGLVDGDKSTWCLFVVESAQPNRPRIFIFAFDRRLNQQFLFSLRAKEKKGEHSIWAARILTFTNEQPASDSEDWLAQETTFLATSNQDMFYPMENYRRALAGNRHGLDILAAVRNQFNLLENEEGGPKQMAILGLFNQD